MRVFERRACTVLYRVLVSHRSDGPYLLPANVCPIVPILLRKAKKRIEFIDVDVRTLCMDHRSLIDRVLNTRERPAGVIYVRSFGAVLDATSVFEQIKSIYPDLLLIDDRCLCAPNLDEQPSSLVDVMLYSTGYAKFAEVGYGGIGFLSKGVGYSDDILPFNDQDLVDLTRRYKFALARDRRFNYVDSDWLDTRPPDADWVNYLEHVKAKAEASVAHKTVINHIYSANLPLSIQLPRIFQSWRFNLLVVNRDNVLRQIRHAGYFASNHYHSLAKNFGRGEGFRAKMIHDHMINLFNDEYISVDQATGLVTLLNRLNLKPPSWYATKEAQLAADVVEISLRSEVNHHGCDA